MILEVLTAVKVDVGFLGCSAVWTCRYTPTFRRKILSPSSTLKALQPRRPTSTILKLIFDKYVIRILIL
jgi:hypothetical protein